ncbi:hypothetical protein BU17DRAFT_44460 [Hysterangium stoloniferum]|nr:hypothetical protein BU17DRAFT_44460 [Hysterangium stoloniferum]
MAAEVDPQNVTYPFAGLDEWELAKWLSTTGLPNTQIDAFLKLSWVKSSPLSFKTSADLVNRIESLPSVPVWTGKWITLPEAPLDPQLLLYQNPVECLEWLEANPDFSGDKDYVPYEEYLNKDHTDRCYSEMASGEFWNDTQAKFPEDITINL